MKEQWENRWDRPRNYNVSENFMSDPFHQAKIKLTVLPLISLIYVTVIIL